MSESADWEDILMPSVSRLGVPFTRSDIQTIAARILGRPPEYRLDEAVRQLDRFASNKETAS